MICLKCNSRAEFRDCTYEEIKHSLCWKCIEMEKNNEKDDYVDLEQIILQIKNEYMVDSDFNE